jgi:hypothetical protein
LAVDGIGFLFHYLGDLLFYLTIGIGVVSFVVLNGNFFRGQIFGLHEDNWFRLDHWYSGVLAMISITFAAEVNLRIFFVENDWRSCPVDTIS